MNTKAPDKKMNKSRLGKITLQKDIFDTALKDNLKSTVDITSLFAYFGVKLVQKGKSHIGLCPWHDDSTPSLSVDKTKGLYNCFGCGESGDIFTLTEKMKGCGFKGAMDFLKGFAVNTFNSDSAFKSATQKNVPVLSAEEVEDDVVVEDVLDDNDLITTKEPKEKANETQQENEDKHGLAGKQQVNPDKKSDALSEKEQANPNEQGDALPKDIFTLDTVADYYHKKLSASKNAMEYLKARGITNEAINHFKIGFCDGTLKEKVGAEGFEKLKSKGLFTEKGYELFSNCIVVPLTDSNDQVLSFYGRSINPRAKVQHLYMPGELKAVFNEKAYKVYDQIILTESVIDALSLFSVGIHNVSCIYGTNGLTDSHITALYEHLVPEVVLALDNDEAGRKAAMDHRDQLVDEDRRVKIIFPEGRMQSGTSASSATVEVKDWNDLLVSGKLSKEAILSAIGKAETVRPKNSGRSFRKTDGGLVLTHEDMTYTVKQDTSSRLSVKCEMDGEVFYDRVDLVSSRSRTSFAGNVSRIFDTETKRIEKDLLALLEYYDDEKDREEENAECNNTYQLSEEERTLGMNLLQNPGIYEEILEDMERLGYVGEDENKLLVYLAGVSRLLPKPLSVFIQSPPSTGKSYLLETLQKMLPEESVEWITSMSDQAFNYMDKEDFLDKIFMLGEALHNETIEGYIRQMQSENKIARKVTMKDPKTGALKSITVSNKARLVFMQTSAAMKANSENLSRCLVLTVDNSTSQTERVLEMQRFKSGYEGYLEEKHVIPEIIKKHKSAQRLLQKIPVFNPFEKYIRFPAIRPIMRRAQGQFLNVMSASCLLRQMQKEPVVMKDHFAGREETVYECDLIDYDTARRLFINGRLLQQDEEISTSAINLYEAIRKMLKSKASKKSLASTEVTFIQKEVRDITTLGNESIKRYLRVLVEYEYLQLVGGKRHGTRFSYRLREDASIDAVDISSLMPTVEEIQTMMRNKTG